MEMTAKDFLDNVQWSRKDLISTEGLTLREIGEIFSLADIAVIRREQDVDKTCLLRERADKYKKEHNARILFIEAEPFEISSTELRACIADGRSAAQYLPKSVEEYIEKCHLYQA